MSVIDGGFVVGVIVIVYVVLVVCYVWVILLSMLVVVWNGLLFWLIEVLMMVCCVFV